MGDDAAPSPTRPAAATAAAIAIAVVLAAGYALYRRPSTPPPRPAAGSVLLAGTFPLEGTGVSRRLRVRVPSTLEFDVSMAGGRPVSVSFGVPAPAEAGPLDRPVAESAAKWTSIGGAPHREVVLAPGMYVLRIEADAPAAGASVAVAVRALPPR